MKTDQIISENNNIIAFQWGIIHPIQKSGSEIRDIQRLEIGRNF